MRSGLGARQVQHAITTIWKNKAVISQALVALDFPPQHHVMCYNLIFHVPKFFYRTY